jgi:tetratricopeptide (TPR) repeat protein
VITYMHPLLIILMLALLGSFSYPQGKGASSPDYQVWIDKIDGINRSGDPNIGTKQDQLRRLYGEYKSLYPEKDLVHARFLHRIAEFYNQQRRIDTAIYLAKKAVEINKTAEHREETYLADTYFNLGQYYKLIDLHEQSLAYLDSSLVISEKLPEKFYVQFRIYEAKAFHHLIVEEYHGTIELVDYALGLKIISGQEKFFHPPLLLHKSRALLELTRMDEAEKCLEVAYTYLKGDYFNEDLIKLYLGYGELNHERKEKEKAESWFLKAKELSEKQGNDHLYVNTLIQLGITYDVLFEDFQKSVDVHLLGVEYLADFDNKVAIAQLYNNLGVSYHEKRDFLKAINCFEKGIEALTGFPPKYKYTKGSSEITYPKGLVVRENYVLLKNLVESLLSLYSINSESELLEKSLSIAIIADNIIDLN